MSINLKKRDNEIASLNKEIEILEEKSNKRRKIESI